MKACPACSRLYPDDAGFCPVDGQGLRSATQVPIQSSDDERVGSLVSMRYQIRRVVADGGMGRVYEALDMQVKRRVAVKMLHSDVAADQVSVERFKREFEVSKDLPHDHIIDVLDFQKEGGTYALVMEFLDGEELRTALQREKTLTPGRMVRMVSQIAIGLDPAHAKKFVHRDLKPDNIFLCGTREGDVVKILDFGSVKDKSAGAKKLTMLGTTIGSPFYMAPEQAQGLDTLDHRADVWAVAAIAYESLTGTVPFMGNNGPTILLSIMTKDPIPPSANAAKAAMPIPTTLDDVMEHAFVKNPQGRIGSVGELADRIGHAYGLEGNFRTWANVPQHELDETIRANLPNLARVKAADVMGDPFAAPNPGAAKAADALDQAFTRAPMPEMTDDAVVPKKGLPPWVLLAGIGAVCLVLGAIVVVVLKMLSRSGREGRTSLLRDAAAASRWRGAPSRGTDSVMTKRVLILSAIVITSVAAGCSSKSEAATNQKSSRVVVAAGAKAETDDYSVELKPAGSYAKDKDGQFEVVIIAKGDKHINEQYPFKFTPKESEDIAYKGAVGREGGTFETTRAVLRVPFVPKKTGGVSVAGKVSLSVCSDKNCLMEKQELELSIAVK